MSDAWRLPAAPAPGMVDVVACWLDVPEPDARCLEALLASEESMRAAALRFDADRRRYVVARARLRQILGALGGCAPAAVVLVTGARGKPRLAEPATSLRFNLAHSADLMLCAVTVGADLGVDVERVRDDVEHESIARRFFAPDEVASLAAVPAAARRDAFYACWTRKEAVIKATGEGLARPLDSFAVSIHPRDARLLRADPALGDVAAWSLLTVPLPPAFRGAVAVQAPAAALRLSWWPTPPAADGGERDRGRDRRAGDLP
jgi:4'-phosphopantetheinyl transferase